MKCSHHWSTILSSLIVAIAVAALGAQAPRPPSARLLSASRFDLPARIDSSNPAVWSLVDGVQRLFVISSWGGVPVRTSGATLESLRSDGPVVFTSHPGHGVWIESIIPADDGAWYGVLPSRAVGGFVRTPRPAAATHRRAAIVRPRPDVGRPRDRPRRPAGNRRLRFRESIRAGRRGRCHRRARCRSEGRLPLLQPVHARSVVARGRGGAAGVGRSR